MGFYDCVIVGSGAVGMSLALTLAQLKYRVLVIEKNSADKAVDERTIALSYASYRIYETLGVWTRLSHQTVPIEAVHVSVEGQYGTSRLQCKEHGVNALGFVIQLALLEEALKEQLKSTSLVDIRYNTVLTQSECSPDEWQLSIQTPTQLEKVSCRLLVAAEGVTSQLRIKQAIGSKIVHYSHYALMASVQMDKKYPFTAIERFQKKGAIALLPGPQEEATCVWTLEEAKAQALMACSKEAFLLACQEALGNCVGRIKAIHQRRCLPLSMHLAKQQIGARFLLIGNAAHSLHPIAAQGLNLSLRDIWQIRSQVCKANTAKVDLGEPLFLNQYIEKRRSDQSRMIFATDKIARFMSGGPLPNWLRALGVTLFDSMDLVKHSFTRYGMGLGL